MDIITTSLEALLQRATNVNNQGPDTAAIDAFCGLINKEPECAQIAAKFITAKVHSLQEWEALQALLVLENCMKRCGSVFHAEAGKFRFLNELIKLVSPKYMGAHTPEPVRRRVLELMHCWTLQFPKEVKMKEAYDMLKKQGVVKEDPPMAPVVSQSRHPPPSILQDEEKSLLLQKLLQSKNPDDLQAANRLIKNMVKEDERRLEEKWRHAVELETAVNNCRLLNEMLDSLEGGSSSEQDLELIRELQATCLSLRPVLFKLATTNAEAPFCQSVLMANDELGDVLTRYQSLVKPAPPTDLHRTDTSTAGHGNSMPPHPDAPSSSLLDLTPISANPPPSALDSMSQLGLELERNVAPPSTQVSYMASLEDIFASPANLPDSVLLPPLVSTHNNCGDKSVPCSNKERTSSKLKGFKELDLLGKSLLEETLSQAKNAQNNKPVKVSMNEMSMPAPLVAEPEMRRPSLLLDDDLLLADNAEVGQPVVEDSPTASTDDVLLVATQSSAATPTPITNSTSDTKPSKTETSPEPPPPLSLADINITLDSIKPSSVAPLLPLEDKNGMSLAIFLARERPRPDVSVFVVTVTSKNPSPLSNFLFQPVVPKSCRVRLLTASSGVLPAHNPFLPPSAITQIMLIASSTKEPISLKFVISYVMEEETFTELGEIDRLPLLDL